MAEGEGGGVLGSDSPGLLRKSEDDHLRPASRALATRVQTEKKNLNEQRKRDANAT